MVKAYLRYVHEESFGLLTSPHSNLSFFSPPGSSHSRTSKSYVLTCSGPAVILWSPAQQVELAKFSPISASSVASSTPHHAVRLALSVFHTHLAVGYSDGSIRVWQMPKAEETVTLAASSALLGRHTERTPGAKGLANLQNPTPHSTLYGHRSAITALRWVGLGQGWTPEEGQRKGQTELETARNVCTADSTFLVSGSAEGDIIVWDRLAGAGLHRIHAHSAPVTDLVVINKRQRGALLPAGRRSEGGGGKRKEVDRDSRKNEKTRNRGEPESSGRGAKLSGAHEGGHSEDDNIGERHGNDFRGHALNRGGGSAETGGQSGMLAISCGKDGSVKIWDVDLELCLQTVVDGIAGTPGGREVWSLAISPNQTRLVVGCADHLLRVYALNQFGGSSFIGTSSLTADETGEGQREVPVDPHTGLARVAVFLGNIPRESSGKRRTTSMQFLSIGSGSPREEQSLLLSEEDEDEGILVVGSGQSRSVEIFKFCGEAERRKRMKRRKKRLQEKQKKRQTGTATEEEEQHERDEDEGEGFKVTDEFVFLSRLYSEGIIKAFHLRAVSASHRRGGEELRKRKRAAQCQQQIEVALGLADNAFEIWDIDIGSLSDRFSQTAIKQEGVVAKTAEANGGLTRVWRVDGGGHRGTIRQLSVSHDSAYLLSVADEVWIESLDSP
ncbi:wd g-beta repeat-containing protein [Cystoisospora suis]|uniref:Wd g-beta repeat-containing protein n=1 Tax=Cystoisospora suis TaxID=483139 RepID=A0A2C6LD14_9APIC|nr:wd g-beta repeat-containing protein [Cystoisospora suis]